MPVAAPTFWNITFGKPRVSGQPNINIVPGTAVAGDMSIVISNASNIVTGGAARTAANSVVDHMISSGLLK